MSPDALPSEQIGLFDAMYTMRAIRGFKPEAIPDSLLRQVLAAAGQAPSGGNRQPWKFIVIRSDERREKVAQLMEENAANRAAGPTAGEFPALLRSAPALIVVCAIAPASTGPQTVGPFGQTFPAIQNLLLAARGLGLGRNVTTGFRAMEKEFIEHFGIPENLTPTCLIPMGFPTGVSPNKHGRGKRLPVEETTFAEKYGEPLVLSG